MVVLALVIRSESFYTEAITDKKVIVMMTSPQPLENSAKTNKFPLQLVVFGQTLLIIVLVILIPLVFLLVRNNKNNNSKASTPTGTATLALSPQTSQLTPNTHQTIDILLNTGVDLVDGAQIVLTFSGNVPNDLSFIPDTVPGLNNIVNTFEPVANGNKALIAFITANPQTPFSTNNSMVKLGSFSMTIPASGTMTATFDETLTTSIKNGTSQDILQTPTNGSYTFAHTAAEPSLSFNTLTPPNPQQVGSNFQVTVVADTAGQLVSGVDAMINFDPAIVEIVSIDQGVGTPFSSYPELTYDNLTGKIYISANIGTAASVTPVSGANVQVASITGRTKIATTSTTLQYDFTPGNRNDSNLSLYLDQPGQEPSDILAKVSGQELIAVNPASPTPGPTSTPGPTATLTPSPTATPTATPLPTSTPVPAANVVLQFALQGKNRTDANKTAQLDLTAQVVSSAQNIHQAVTTDASGQAQLSLVPDNYVFLVKTPGYLARKIGSTASPVQVTGGVTPVNLTSSPLLGGDFNADDEINSIDYTLKFLNALRSNDPVVDLDNSGVVNNLDFAIMRNNWAKQSDIL